VNRLELLESMLQKNNETSIKEDNSNGVVVNYSSLAKRLSITDELFNEVLLFKNSFENKGLDISIIKELVKVNSTHPYAWYRVGADKFMLNLRKREQLFEPGDNIALIFVANPSCPEEIENNITSKILLPPECLSPSSFSSAAYIISKNIHSARDSSYFEKLGQVTHTLYLRSEFLPGSTEILSLPSSESIFIFDVLSKFE